MSLHIVILGLTLLLALGLFMFGWLTEQKAFFIGSFIIIMLSGVFIQAEQGILLGHQVEIVDSDTGLISYTNIEYPTSNPGVNLFSWVLVLLGGVLTAFSGISFVFSSPTNNPYHY